MDPRTCPECGETFTPKSGRARFCSVEHKIRFHAASRLRGQMAIPFLLTWRKGKNTKDETLKADAAYAFNMLAQMADDWNMEDRANGRQPQLCVREKREAAWRPGDRTIGG